MEIIERYRGCLIGLAAGDALGTTLEFSTPGSFTPTTDMIGGGPFHLAPGQWTDDTSMALCLAESLLECQGFDPKDQMGRYLRWYRQGYLSSTGVCFDIGTTTRIALERFERTQEPFSGSADPRRAGNGSLMRLAPVAMFFARQPEQAIEKCAESSRTTHATLVAMDACRFFGGLLVGALKGESKNVLLNDHYSPLPGYWDKHPLASQIAEIASGSYKRKEPAEIRGTGFVAATLEAALWAFYHHDDFKSGCLGVVNLGDDTDTTGAVFGQLAGAFYGEPGIPAQWRKLLTFSSLINRYSEQLFKQRC